MSGRGRGRGRGRAAAPPSVANAATGFAVAAIAPATTVPPPRFPPTPLPEAHDPPELDAARFTEELRYYMQKHSPAHLGTRRPKGTLAAPVVDRYSDKYALDAKAAAAAPGVASKISAIVTDLAFFPEELHSVYQSGSSGRRTAAGAPPATVEPHASFLDTLARIKALEGRDEDSPRDAPSSQADQEGRGEGEADGEEDEVVYEEEELEDETDYNLTYFDNGEDYGDHDDGDEGPVY